MCGLCVYLPICPLLLLGTVNRWCIQKALATSNYRQRILRHYAVEELLQRYSAVIVPVEPSHNINQVIIRGVALVFREHFLQALNGEEASTEAVQVLEGCVVVELGSAGEALFYQLYGLLNFEMGSETLQEFLTRVFCKVTEL